MALACISATGCGVLTSPEPDVRVSIASAHFDADEDLRFEIRNDLPVPIEFSTCDDGRIRMGLRRRVEGVWRGVAEGDPCRGRAGPSRELESGALRMDSRPGVSEEGLYVLWFTYFKLSESGRPLARIRRSRPSHVTR